MKLATNIFLFSALISLFFMSGCDFLAKKLGIDEVEVSLSSVATDLVVDNEVSTAKRSDVNLQDVKDLPDIFTIDQVIIEKDQFSFTPATKNLKSIASGRVGISVFFEDGNSTLPIYYGVAEIQDNQIVSISPSRVSIGEISISELVHVWNAIPESTKSGWNKLNTSEAASSIEDKFNTQIKNGKLDGLTMAIKGLTGDVSGGKLSISKMKVHLDF